MSIHNFIRSLIDFLNYHSSQQTTLINKHTVGQMKRSLVAGWRQRTCARRAILEVASLAKLIAICNEAGTKYQIDKIMTWHNGTRAQVLRPGERRHKVFDCAPIGKNKSEAQAREQLQTIITDLLSVISIIIISQLMAAETLGHRVRSHRYISNAVPRATEINHPLWRSCALVPFGRSSPVTGGLDACNLCATSGQSAR